MHSLATTELLTGTQVNRLHPPAVLLTPLIATFLLVISTESSAMAQGAKGPVIVQLKESVVLNESQIKLGDIATVTDTDRTRRRELQELDLASFDATGTLTIDRSLVEIRILLSGLSSDHVQVKGAERVVISPPPEVVLTDLGVEQAVFDSLCRQFSIDPADLRVSLVAPFLSTGIQGLEQLKDPRLELTPPGQLPLGRVQLTVRLLEGGRVVLARPVTFEVARRQPVVVATTSLDRNSLVTSDHLREEFRFVDGPIDRLSVSQIVGRKVMMPFRPDEVVTLRHVGQVAQEESPVLIQPRDAVRLVAKKRGLTVTIPVAEAMQAGREGQLIKVRNVQSNQIVTGVVAGRGEVHVVLP